eukprot:CAMPEP_0185772978 /NCGR_PEP_ID=MMETSP1174-20130828/72080_1 /TAXON_ID=35687 /ORGANISM="Dictyocha speculum, Strain CCMP1381" /LENGTH=192 /DNA_ID=CAMNT_0028459497 /DNA_START=119 /DNA_END=698 /DNA_ORIENTATION=+
MPRKGPPKPVPEGYVCRACDKPGHWVFDCALKTKKKSKKKRATVDGAVHTSCEDDTKSDDKKTLDPSDDNYIPPLKRPKSGLSAVTNNDPKFRCPTEEDVRLAQQNMPVIGCRPLLSASAGRKPDPGSVGSRDRPDLVLCSGGVPRQGPMRRAVDLSRSLKRDLGNIDMVSWILGLERDDFYFVLAGRVFSE